MRAELRLQTAAHSMDRAAWIAKPANRLPSVSWSESPTTAVSSAEGFYLYWTESSSQSTLKRVPIAGGPAEIVPTQGQLQSLAFDACNVYIGSINPTQVLVTAK